MAAPIIQYYLFDPGTLAETPLTLLTFQSTSGGAVKAGSNSKSYVVRIYNAKGAVAGDNIATATDVDITTKTSSGGDTGSAVVEQKWIRVNKTGETTFPNDIGGTDVLAIDSIAYDNFTPVELRATVPGNAPANTYPFLIRTSYSYT